MAGPGVRVRPLVEEDIPAVSLIEERAFEASWPATAFAREIRENRLARYLVAERVSPGADPAIVGFAGLWLMVDQAHVVTVGVEPNERGQGLGLLLVEQLLRLAETLGMTDATLEVRESNSVARALYRGMGFYEVGRRPRYYENVEDAVIMTTEAFDSPGYATHRERTCERVARRFPVLETLSAG